MREAYEAFVKRLYGSSAGVFAVAAWLHKGGRTVTIPPLRVVPFGHKADSYADDGDLIVTNEKGETSVIEVKHLDAKFTCLEDWPFKDMIVSSVGSVDRKRGKVKAYIMLSKDMNYVAVLSCDTGESWRKIKRFSKNTKREEDFYVCDPALCKFIFIGEKE